MSKTVTSGCHQRCRHHYVASEAGGIVSLIVLGLLVLDEQLGAVDPPRRRPRGLVLGQGHLPVSVSQDREPTDCGTHRQPSGAILISHENTDVMWR